MRLLIIEDDQTISANLKRYLSTKEFTVDCAKNIEEGLYFLEEESFDCIILDWMLPDGEGTSLLKKMRDRGLSTPVILLTARSQIEDKIEGFSLGSDDYLTKPFSMAELEARIGALIRRTTAAKSSPMISCGEVTVDLNKCTVSVDSKLVNLSPKEYTLLEYLMLHKEMVVSRDKILRHVWGENEDVLSNTVDVHISNLRKKVFTTSGVEIKTIVNKGYMLCKT